MSKPNEKRRHPRRAVRLLVSHRKPDSPTPARDYLTDISQSGMFLRTKTLPTIGETLHVEFAPRPDSTETIKAQVQVARVTPEGVGAAFTQLDPDSALLLNLLLAV